MGQLVGFLETSEDQAFVYLYFFCLLPKGIIEGHCLERNERQMKYFKSCFSSELSYQMLPFSLKSLTSDLAEQERGFCNC